MFKMLFGLIFKLRDLVQKKFGDIFEKFRDPDSGKVTFARPQTLRRIVSITGLIVFFLVLITQVINSGNNTSGGVEAFEKEARPNSGIGSRDVRQAMEDDPFKSLNSITRDEFGNKDALGGSGVTGVVDDQPLSAAQCLVIVDKMKANTKLTADEEILADQCLKENPMGLTADELKFAKMMLDPNTSDAEKALLAKALNGTATDAELAVAKALASGDAEKVAQAKAAIAMGDAGINALGKSLTGQPLTDEEKRLLAQINENAKTPGEKVAGAAGAVASEALKGLTGTFSKDVAESAKNLNLPAPQDEAIKALAQDVANREELLKSMASELAKEQLQASPIAEKFASGKQLSAPETKRLQDFTRRKQEFEALQKLQEDRKKMFADRANKFQTSLAQAVTTVQQSLPSGTFVEYEGNVLDCKKIKPLAVKRRPVTGKAVAKLPPGTILDVDGRPLKPEEVEFIKLHRKNQYEVAKLKKDATNGPDFNGGLGQPINVAAMAGEGGAVGIQDLQSLFVFKDNSLKNFELTPDMKIPAVLDSEILVSDKGKGQMVRFRILADVHNPATNQIVIPKGSIATATTSSFDQDTGIMELTIEKAVIGSGRTVSVRLLVGSADGSMGLRGQVRDTTGKYLAGAFITAFSAGALNWFSQQVVAPFQTSTNAGQALTGAGLAGGGEVMSKIAELYSSKLQNAAVVFWVPKGVPIVLFPQ